MPLDRALEALADPDPGDLDLVARLEDLDRDRLALHELGRAAQLAAATGDHEATNRLKRVVDIEDAETGTVRLKAKVSKLDEMALDTSSTKTTRVKR